MSLQDVHSPELKYIFGHRTRPRPNEPRHAQIIFELMGISDVVAGVLFAYKGHFLCANVVQDGRLRYVCVC